jgi:hypothetical protein
MTPQEFRTLALGLPGAVESEHGEHPDFRTNGRVFATLGYPGAGCGMVKLTPERQRALIDRAPAAFSPAKGAWGRAGSTIVRLDAARKADVKAALRAAFEATQRPRRKA